MRLYIWLLRVLLVVLFGGLCLLGVGVGVGTSNFAQTYPEFEPQRQMVYFAVMAGLIPISWAGFDFFRLLARVDRGEAFSDGTTKMLRRIRLLFTGAAVYLALGYVWLSLITTWGYQLVPPLVLGQIFFWLVVGLAGVIENLLASRTAD